MFAMTKIDGTKTLNQVYNDGIAYTCKETPAFEPQMSLLRQSLSWSECPVDNHTTLAGFCHPDATLPLLFSQVHIVTMSTASDEAVLS